MSDAPRRLDLAAIRAEWLTMCGSCDAGLPMSCTCPDSPGDARPVIARIVDEVERLRRVVAEYERRITWDTTCAGCADWLDASYAADARAERAELERDEARAELAENTGVVQALRAELAACLITAEDLAVLAWHAHETGGPLQQSVASRALDGLDNAARSAISGTGNQP